MPTNHNTPAKKKTSQEEISPNNTLNPELNNQASTQIFPPLIMQESQTNGIFNSADTFFQNFRKLIDDADQVFKKYSIKKKEIFFRQENQDLEVIELMNTVKLLKSKIKNAFKLIFGHMTIKIVTEVKQTDFKRLVLLYVSDKFLSKHIKNEFFIDTL